MEEQTESQLANAWRVEALDKVPAARLLTLLAGSTAVVLGILAFLLQFTMGPRIGPLGLFGTAPLLLMLLIDLAFGALLLYVYAGMEAREADGAVLSLAFALVLLVLGGVAGAVAGILAGVGAAVTLVRTWRAPPTVS